LTNPKFAEHEQKVFTLSEIIGEELNSIIRFENLDRDFDKLCTQLGQPYTTLPCPNGSYGRSIRPEGDYYDYEAIEIVSKNWADDLRRFNYSWDNSKICKLRKNSNLTWFFPTRLFR